MMAFSARLHWIKIQNGFIFYLKWGKTVPIQKGEFYLQQLTMDDNIAIEFQLSPWYWVMHTKERMSVWRVLVSGGRQLKFWLINICCRLSKTKKGTKLSLLWTVLLACSHCQPCQIYNQFKLDRIFDRISSRWWFDSKLVYNIKCHIFLIKCQVPNKCLLPMVEL